MTRSNFDRRWILNDRHWLSRLNGQGNFNQKVSRSLGEINVIQFSIFFFLIENGLWCDTTLIYNKTGNVADNQRRLETNHREVQMSILLSSNRFYNRFTFLKEIKYKFLQGEEFLEEEKLNMIDKKA